MNREPITHYEIMTNVLSAGELLGVLENTSENVYEQYPELFDELKKENSELFKFLYDDFKNFFTKTESDLSEQVLIVFSFNDTESGVIITIRGCEFCNSGTVFESEDIFTGELIEIHQMIKP